jgi:predicted component of viral defense system (DUF524 family)
MTAEYYPVIKLSLKTDDLTIEITSSEDREVPSFCKETVGTFEVTRGDEPWPLASLVYCAEPKPGQACIQAREQTNYDLWFTWEGKDAPKILLGDNGTSLTLKRHGQQGYTILNWGNYVGASDLWVMYSGEQVCRLPVEVRSHKMDYLNDYRTMLDDISEQLAALVFNYGSPTAVYTQRAALDAHVAYLDYLFLRYLMDEKRLPLHFCLVAANPHRTTEREIVWTDLALARSLTPRSLQAVYAHAKHLTRPQRVVAPALQSQLQGYVPRQLLDDRVVTTLDTAPNRFVNHFLGQLVLKLCELEARFSASVRGEHLAVDCRRWRRSVENLARAHFLEEVGKMHIYPAGSQVLLKREGYRQLNDYYRRFLLTGKVVWEGFEELLKTPNKDLATLYEYWCFFQLLDAVAAALNAQADPRQFIVEERDTFRVTINQRGKSWGKVGQVTIYYNRYFRHQPGESYSVTLHPDYTVELPGGRRFIFDAKYKYDHPGQFMSGDMSADEERDEEERLVYKKGDLYKMHTYRDALGAQAVFVIYPGNEFRAYHLEGHTLTDPCELSDAFEGVGAIPTQVHDPEPLVSCVHWLLVSKSS